MANLLTSKLAINALEKAAIEPYRALSPTLAVIAKNACPFSESAYIKQLEKKGKAYGATVEIYGADGIVDVYKTITALSDRRDVNGIIMVSSFASECNCGDQFLRDYIPADLDVDCMSSESMGKFVCDTSPLFYRLAPCTAAAVYKIFQYNGIDVGGKRVGIVGRSSRVGMPLANMLTKCDGTVTLYHSKSDLSHLKDEDIVVTAIGVPKFFKGQHFRSGQIVVDVGINSDPETGYVCGDVDFKAVSDVIGDSGSITPVPGCVGPLTDAILFSKLFQNAKRMSGAYFKEECP